MCRPSGGCARLDEEYWDRLSDASKHSLEVQNGRMRSHELVAFEAQDGWQAAVALRRYDDLGKQPDREVPGLDSYREILLELALMVV